MIFLTNPFKILDLLGGTATVDYDSVFVLSLNVNVNDDSANGAVELRSSAPSRPPVRGGVRIFTNTNPRIEVEFPQLGHFKTVGLTAPQASGVSAIFQQLKNDVESGLVSLGLVDGTQS